VRGLGDVARDLTARGDDGPSRGGHRLLVAHEDFEVRQSRNGFARARQIGVCAQAGSTGHALSANGELAIGERGVGRRAGAAFVLHRQTRCDVGVVRACRCLGLGAIALAATADAEPSGNTGALGLVIHPVGEMLERDGVRRQCRVFCIGAGDGAAGEGNGVGAHVIAAVPCKQAGLVLDGAATAAGRRLRQIARCFPGTAKRYLHARPDIALFVVLAAGILHGFDRQIAFDVGSEHFAGRDGRAGGIDIAFGTGEGDVAAALDGAALRFAPAGLVFAAGAGETYPDFGLEQRAAGTGGGTCSLICVSHRRHALHGLQSAALPARCMAPVSIAEDSLPWMF
jgi:hypothetical protein